MDSSQNIPFMNPAAHFIQPGTVDFVPAWIIMIIAIIDLALLFPKFFAYHKESQLKIISPFLLFFLFGSLMPIFDDILAFIFGPPFAHHSLFHSLFGSLLTFVIFRLLSTNRIAFFALFGNLFHIFFNFYFDTVTLFFPLTYQQNGLTDVIKLNTYWIKAITYPVIFLTYSYLMVKYSLHLRKEQS